MIALAVLLSFQERTDSAVSVKEIKAVIERRGDQRDGDPRIISRSGDRAFNLLWPIVQKEIQTQAWKKDRDQFHRFRATLQYLLISATRKETRRMISIYDRIGSSREVVPAWCGQITRWLATNGDVLSCRKTFEQAARQTGQFEGEWGVEGLRRIGDDMAIHTLVGLLEKRTVSPEVRPVLFAAIAWSGRPYALASVRRAMEENRTMPDYHHRDAPLNDPRWPALSEYTDAKGTKWGLVKWYAFGSIDDVWLVHQQGGKWVDPVYTEIKDVIPLNHVRDPDPGHEKEVEAWKALIEGKGWVNSVLGSTELMQDSDGDGLSDIAEKRLGLDPSRADSDGDGIPDPIDRNPLARPRKLNDMEQAIRAGVSTMASQYAQPAQNVLITWPPYVSPMEITTCNGPVYPVPNGFTRTGQYLRCIMVPNPFSTDRKTFTFTISREDRTSVGGFRATVRKIGDDWYCVGLERTYSAAS